MTNLPAPLPHQDTPGDIPERGPEKCERFSGPDTLEDIAARMKGHVSRLFVTLEDTILPNPVETYLEPWTRMHAVYARQLRTHVLRVEYCLRCFILFLCERLLATEEGRRAALAPRETPFRMPPQKRPYDPLIILEGDDKPPAKGRFSMLSAEPKGPRKHYRHYYPFKPLDWAEIDISKLIARLNRLPAALKNADRYAERLAHSLMAGDYALSEDEARTPSVSMLNWDDQSSRASTYCPVFFRQLDTWHPPPELSEFTLDDERADLQILHLHAGDALSSCAMLR